tara:strand:- start:391 stop:519 length:129 start_codon:yes stop_codon:yes gene_type:complete
MTLSEKIANAKKRIDELEVLIQYWDTHNRKSVNSIIDKADKH